MFSPKQLLLSFRYAIKGLAYIWSNEQNFRAQVVIAVLVIVAMIGFRVTLGPAVVLLMLIIFVLVLEIINTIFEKLVDILKPRIHIYVQVIKDMMAAAVFISAIGSAVIGLLIFIPYIVAVFYS